MLRYFMMTVLAGFHVVASAQIRLPDVLSDNMVLQRNDSALLWGWASPGEKIRIQASWKSTPDSAVSSGGSIWSVKIKTPDAGGPYTIKLRGWNTIELKNILIGEVWVCSGQSNMEWSGNHGLPDIKAELATCADDQLRFFQVPKITSNSPQDNVPGKWTSCDSNTLKPFSAIGYFFGKELRKKLGVPVALINSSWGGTPAEVWTPAELVTGAPQLAAAAAKQGVNGYRPHVAGKTYNAMIAPITNYRIAGAIWYQGESNTGTASTYQPLMETMIGSWRKAWRTDFPFYYVQIAPFTYGAGTVKGALLRESQEQTLSYPKTGMVVITDLVDDTTNIHPINKHDVGQRLANLALGDHYGKQGIAFKSPQFDKMEKKNNQIILHFKHADNGLVLKGAAKEWFIAGADKKFVPADVKVKGNIVTVSAKGLAQPEAVRFAFSNSGIGNIFSKEGLPVSPFRTDSWPEQ